AGLQRHDRLLPRDAPGDPPELAWVAERLEIEEHDVGFVVVLPPLEQVVGRHVCLVADRDEGREAEPPGGGLLEQRQPEGPALRREADRAGRQGSWRERGVQAEPRSRDAEAVRPDQARPVCTDEREQLLLALKAPGPGLRKTRRDHAEGARARGE